MNAIAIHIARLAGIKAETIVAIGDAGSDISELDPGIRFDDLANYLDPLSGMLGKIIDKSIGATTLPPGLTTIGAYAFRDCTSLALSALPAGITSIGTYAFSGCTSLALSALPAGLTSISTSAFRDCAGLTEITFLSTPSGAISTSAFANCNNLLVIRVPWASGAKADAPWGAKNATIIYNYQG